jgi:S-adenosylmethionine/arginine decarboxylase-like enzyme
LLNHQHVIISARVRKPPVDTVEAVEWFKQLVDAIGMKIADTGHQNPQAWYCEAEGNVGMTVAGIIETSHIVMHSWTACGRLELDVYSCAEIPVDRVIQALRPFEASEFTYKFLDRNDGLKILA